MSKYRLVFRIHALQRMRQRHIEADKTMKCVICKYGETAPGEATVTLEQAGATLVIKDVPARVCTTCGEEYVDEAIAAQLLKIADEATRAGVQVDVRRYMAA